MTILGDAELVERLAAGDPAAFADAYRVHAARCRAVAYRVLRDSAAAEDALQEAFAALWRHREGLVVRAAGVGPWLVVTARNAALGMLRASTRRSARERADAGASAPIDMTAEHAADAIAVRDAVEALPDEQRSVLRLAYFDGMTLASIAERTETPLGTVKRRAQLGLRKLARLLGDDAS